MADITVDDVNAQVEIYRDAMVATDYAAARDALLTIRGMVEGLPNVTGQDGALVSWGRTDIDKLLDRLDDLDSGQQAQTSGKGPLKMFHIRPGRAGDGQGSAGSNFL